MSKKIDSCLFCLFIGRILFILLLALDANLWPGRPGPIAKIDTENCTGGNPRFLVVQLSGGYSEGLGQNMLLLVLQGS